MNGSIKVQSEVKKGTTFQVILKNIEVGTLDISDLEEQNDEDIFFETATILLVDDVATNRKLINSLLLNTKLNIIEAINGQEAVDIIQKSNDIDSVDNLLNGYKTLVNKLENLKGK